MQLMEPAKQGDFIVEYIGEVGVRIHCSSAARCLARLRTADRLGTRGRHIISAPTR